MGNMNIAPQMVTASPEAREALTQAAKGAAATAAKHLNQIKDSVGDTGKAVAAGAIVGGAVGFASPIPGGTLIGTGVGAAAAAAGKAIANSAKADDGKNA